MRVEKDRLICTSSHLTDFSVLLGADLDDSDSGEDLVVYILSAIFIGVALILIILVTILFIKFPTLRRLILDGERPGAAKKRNDRRVAHMKRKTMEQYGVTQTDAAPSL